MSVAVAIFHPALKKLVGDPEGLQLSGSTVGEALQDLTDRFPGAREMLFNKHGDLLRPVYVFVNQEGMGKAKLSRTLQQGDRLIIAVLASGG